MRRLVIFFASLASLAGCQYRDGLYCMKHPEDLGNCGRNDGGIDGQVGAHIGGTVNGLKGNGLVLQDNGTDDYPIFGGTGAAVMFQFPDVLPYGSSYAVTVTQQPANPSQTCTVANGTGTADTDVNSIDVTCATPSFAIGGGIAGLGNNSGLSLHNSVTGEDLPVAPNATSFTFVTKVPSGAGYTITIGAQPSGISCNIFGGQGTVGNSDVTNIVVNCGTNQYVVYGNISGLQGTVMLKDTNTNPTDSDTLTTSANGGFAFTKTIVTGETYSVGVMANPTYNAMTGSLQQTCTPANNSGTAPSINPASVSCTTNTYTIGGSVSGLMGSVTLHENTGNDDVTLNASGNFTFANRIASGSTYTVVVKTQPAMVTCTVTANATGTVTNANITNVGVTCMYIDPGIACGSTYCDPSNMVCCGPETGTPTCASSAAGACTDLPTPCDDKADCGGQNCCANENGGHNQVQSIGCQAAACSDATLCDHNAPGNPCGAGKSCKPYSLLSGYYSCQ
jgi:hypothetical protein